MSGRRGWATHQMRSIERCSSGGMLTRKRLSRVRCVELGRRASPDPRARPRTKPTRMSSRWSTWLRVEVSSGDAALSDSKLTSFGRARGQRCSARRLGGQPRLSGARAGAPCQRGSLERSDGREAQIDARPRRRGGASTSSCALELAACSYTRLKAAHGRADDRAPLTHVAPRFARGRAAVRSGRCGRRGRRGWIAAGRGARAADAGSTNRRPTLARRSREARSSCCPVAAQAQTVESSASWRERSRSDRVSSSARPAWSA